MQNELRATSEGVVTKITATEGATVETGAALLTLGFKRADEVDLRLSFIGM